MKLLLVVATVVAVAVAGPTQRNLVDNSPAIIDFPLTETGEVIDSPVSIGPAVIDFPLTETGEVIGSPVSIDPAIIDFPLTENGEAITPAEVPVAPVVVGPPAPAQSSPLVQLIVNVNTAQAAQIPRPEPVGIPDPVVVPQPVIVPEPVQIVDNWPVVVPVNPAEEIEITPVQVVDTAPVAVEPVIIGTPVLPSPAVTLPLELN